MKDFKEVLERIYNEQISVVLDGIEDEYQEQIIEGYKNYLDETYTEPFGDVSNLDYAYETISSAEKKFWINCEADFKESRLIADEALDSIDKISAYAYRAIEKKEKINKLIREDDANYYIDKMQALLELVKSFNREYAEDLVSETMMDLLNASGQTEDRSFRSKGL